MITLLKPLDLRWSPPNELSAIASTLAVPFYVTPVAGIAIRDTANHDPVTDAANVLIIDARLFSGPKLIYVKNGCDTNCTISMMVSFDDTAANFVTQGSGQTAAAGQTSWVSFSSLGNLQHAYPYVSFRISHAVAPVSGNLIAGYVLRSQ